MDIKPKGTVYIDTDKIREVLKDLEPGTMLTLEMPGVPDGSGPGRKKEGESADGRSV